MYYFSHSCTCIYLSCRRKRLTKMEILPYIYFHRSLFLQTTVKRLLGHFWREGSISMLEMQSTKLHCTRSVDLFYVYRTSLTYFQACLNESVRVVMAETLLKRGAKVNEYATSCFLFTSFVCFSFLYSLASSLCVYTDYRNRVTIDGQTPMDYSIRLGREDLCDLLVRNGASPQLEPQIELAKKLKFTRIADKLRAFYGNSSLFSWRLPSFFVHCLVFFYRDVRMVPEDWAS